MKSESLTRCAEIISMLCSVLDLTHPEESRKLRALSAAFLIDVSQERYMHIYKTLRILWLDSELAGLAFCALPSWEENLTPEYHDALFGEFAKVACKRMN